MSWRQRLIGRPVLIASHAGPVHRGRVGPVIALHGHVATVELSTPTYLERVNVDLRGLRLLRKRTKTAIAA